VGTATGAAYVQRHGKGIGGVLLLAVLLVLIALAIWARTRSPKQQPTR